MSAHDSRLVGTVAVPQSPTCERQTKWEFLGMYRGHPGQVCSKKLPNPRCHDQCFHKYRSIVGLLWLGGIVDLSLLESVAEDVNLSSLVS